MNTSNHIVSDINNKLKEVSDKYLNPMMSPDTMDMDEENGDALSFQEAFIKLDGYEKVKVLNNLKKSIENELEVKLTTLSPGVNSIYDATFVTIDNELKKQDSNSDFEIKDEENDKWNWPEINQYEELLSNVNNAFDSLNNEELQKSLKENKSFQEYMDGLIKKCEEIALSLFTKGVSSFVQIILQAATLYDSSDEYCNPSQAVRLAEVIRYKLNVYLNIYRLFLKYMMIFLNQ